MVTTTKRILWSSVLVLLIVIAASNIADRYAKDYSEQAISRSLVAFAIARGMNGIISVAQGTEVAIHPAGLGLNFAPGQVLDPVNDLLEQFSWVMLACAATLGIQKVLLAISATTLITVLFCGLLLFWLARVWFPEKIRFNSGLILSLTLILLFMRFSVLVSAIASEGLYSLYLSNQYQAASERLQGSSKALESLNKQLSQQQNLSEGQEQSLMEKAKQFFSNSGFSLDYEKTIERYRRQAEQLADSAIDLIVVFIIQSILFPLFTLWSFYIILRKFYHKFVASISIAAPSVGSALSSRNFHEN